MKPLARLVAVVTGLVLMLNGTPSWGQLVNPTVSDANGNTAGGTDALANVDETAEEGGYANTAFGTLALFHTTTGKGNTASGFQALTNNITGFDNTAIGAGALVSNSTGSRNTASGVAALNVNTTGSFNTATGSGTLFLNTGSNNTASGADALQSNITGSFNTASGWSALLNNNTGSENTATGSQALMNMDGSFNTASGVRALAFSTTGNKNTAVGTNALSVSTGNRNVALGFNAGANHYFGNNNIYIGSPGVSTESLTMRLGSIQKSTFIAGVATATVSGATVEVDANGQLGVATSSARYKRDIAAMGTRSEGVLQLRPVIFAYKNDAQGVTHYGLIAEEVAAVYPELVTHTPAGEVQTVRYQELIPMLLNELQRQRQEFQQELAALRALVGQGRGAEAAIPSPTVAAGETGSVPR